MSAFIVDPPPAFSPVSAFDAHLDRVRLLIRDNPTDAGLRRALRIESARLTRRSKPVSRAHGSFNSTAPRRLFAANTRFAVDKLDCSRRAAGGGKSSPRIAQAALRYCPRRLSRIAMTPASILFICQGGLLYAICAP